MARTMVDDSFLPGHLAVRLHSCVPFPHKHHSYSLKEIAQYNQAIDNMRAWCEKNCRDTYYVTPAWCNVWSFADDEDLTAFMLVWGGYNVRL